MQVGNWNGMSMRINNPWPILRKKTLQPSFWQIRFAGSGFAYLNRGGLIMPTTVLPAPPDFQTLRRACLLTDWQFFEIFLTTAWQISDDCMTAPWQLSNKWLATTWQMPDNYLTIFWQLPNNFLTISRQHSYDFLKTYRRLQLMISSGIPCTRQQLATLVEQYTSMLHFYVNKLLKK